PGALNLRPAVSKDAVSEPKNLSPSAQLVFLWWLYSDNEATAAEISEGLGLSKASVLRGCEALVAAGLLSKRIGGAKKRTALFSIPDYLSFAEKGTRLFGDPIEDDFYVSASDASGLPLCGESALARRSMLVAPHVPMYASSRKEGRVLAELARDQNEPIELAMVRVLSYDPCAMAHDGVVDAFTMWKTVDVDDERTRLGLDEALGGYRWYASQE
ncbi:MAG: helix-turn-helix domain-containing protein, partial [Raoultibacter sp.]